MDFLNQCQKKTQPMSALFKRGTKSIEVLKTSYLRGLRLRESRCTTSLLQFQRIDLRLIHTVSFSDSWPCFSLSSAQLRYLWPSGSCRSIKISVIYKHKSSKATGAEGKESYRRSSWGEGRVRAATTANIGFVHSKKFAEKRVAACQKHFHHTVK